MPYEQTHTFGLVASLTIAAALAMDASAVAAGIGSSLRKVTARQAFRLSWHFGLFQFFMPIIGWYLGAQASRYIQAYDHWVAFGLLAVVGGHMLVHAFGRHPAGTADRDPTRGLPLIILSVGTSIDALAVGITIGLIGTPIWFIAVVIGVVTSLLTLAGLGAGRIMGRLFGEAAEVLGGLILITIGVKILVQHLSAG